jgi:AcrR family transcriptional regulator
MYRHYRSKDDLARDLFVTNFVALGRELRRAQAEEATTEGKIRAMIRYFCTVYEQDPDMFTYLFLARHDHMQAIQSRMANPYFVFRRVIRDGMNRGEVPKQDPDVAASMVMGVVLQVIDSRLLGDRIRKSISTLADTIAAACWRVLQVS